MSEKPPTNPWLVVLVASLATFMEVLDTTITNVSLRHIAGSLGAGQDESTWVITSYLVANGIILPLSGWLSDVFGRKKYFIFCILGFTLSSFFCGASTSLITLIVFRVIQGAAGGGLQPAQQAIVLDLFPPEKRGTVFAITGITMVVAPILGPTLGGIITDHVSWRWIFYINIPVGLISAFLIWKMVEDPPHAKSQGFRKVDFTSLGFLSLGLAALQIVLDKGQQEDWFGSTFICTWAIISFVCIAITLIWLTGQKDKIVDISLFKDRAFAVSCALMFCVGFVLYGSTAILPILLQSHFGYTATLAGLILSPSAIVVLLLMPFVGKIVNKIQARYLILFGLFLQAFGMFYSTNFNIDSDFGTFRVIRIFQMIGLPFLFIPISTLAFMNIPAIKRNKASAIFALARNLGGSVGIAVVISYAARSQQIHQNYLASNLVPGRESYEALFARIQNLTENPEQINGIIYRMLDEQAAMLAYIDAYKFLGIIMVFAIIISIFLLPGNKIEPKAEPVAVH